MRSEKMDMHYSSDPCPPQPSGSSSGCGGHRAKQIQGEASNVTKQNELTMPHFFYSPQVTYSKHN
jgi:hypothetical protein